jgi:hypothetical protein
MPTQPAFTCATCDDQIAHHPVFHLGLAFCCAGCAADGPCTCSYDIGQEAAPQARANAAAPVVAAVRIPETPLMVASAEEAAAAHAPRGDARRRGDGRRRSEEPTLMDVGS